MNVIPQKSSLDSKLGDNAYRDTYFAVEEEADWAPNATEGSENSGSVPLTWRGDPAETHSDWTIMIVTNELQTVSYHVHKSVLCYGSRNSRYFARLLMTSEVKQMVKVELDAVDAVNFPILLDYIYAPCSYSSALGTLPTVMSTLTSPSLLSMSKSSEDEASYLALGEDVNSNNAVSIRFLARKFEIDSLTLAANRFIQRDLNVQSAPRYLTIARAYEDERLQESATRLCVENFMSLDKKAITNLPLDIFRRLIMSIQGSQEELEMERSWFLSELVCRYMEKHTNYVTVDLLLELTEPSLMPFMAADAAMGFTALIKTLSPETIARNWHDLARFSRRCARSVVRDYGWNDFSVTGAVDEYLNQYADFRHPISHTETLLFATSLAAALDQAQLDYRNIVSVQENLQQMIGNLNMALEATEKMSDRKDKYMTYQSNALEDAHNRIEFLERELAEARQMAGPTHQFSQRHTPPKGPPAPHSQRSSPMEIIDVTTRKDASPSRRPSPSRSEAPRPRRQTPHHTTKSLIDDVSSRDSSSWQPRPPHSASHQQTKSLLDALSMSRSQSTTADSVTAAEVDPAIRDLISPTSIGTEVHRNKLHKMKELRHKAGGLRGFCGSLG